jgi:hypothetical protein
MAALAADLENVKTGGSVNRHRTDFYFVVTVTSSTARNLLYALLLLSWNFSSTFFPR